MIHPVYYLNFRYPAAHLNLSAFCRGSSYPAKDLCLDLKTSLQILHPRSCDQVSGQGFSSYLVRNII